MQNKLIDDTSINDEASRYWPEVEQRQYAFDRAACEEREMRKLGVSELAAWAQRELLSPAARKLTVQVRKGAAAAGAGTADVEEPMPEGAVRIGGAEQFKAGLTFRPPDERPLPPLEAIGEPKAAPKPTATGRGRRAAGR